MSGPPGLRRRRCRTGGAPNATSTEGLRRGVIEVYARGSNNRDPEIGTVGDVDTAPALCTLDVDTIAVVSASLDGAGHDVRLEIQGSMGTVLVGSRRLSGHCDWPIQSCLPYRSAARNLRRALRQTYRDAMVALRRRGGRTGAPRQRLACARHRGTRPGPDNHVVRHTRNSAASVPMTAPSFRG